MRVQKSKVDWKAALRELSPNAYYLLSTLYYADIDDAKDSVILRKVPYSDNPYKRAKAELVGAGYLVVKQVSRYEYKYIVGKDKIDKDESRYELKGLIDEMLGTRIMLEGRKLTDVEIRQTKSDATDIINARKQARELEEAKGIEI